MLEWCIYLKQFYDIIYFQPIVIHVPIENTDFTFLV